MATKPINMMLIHVSKIVGELNERCVDWNHISDPNSTLSLLRPTISLGSREVVSLVIKRGMEKDHTYAITIASVVFLRFKWKSDSNEIEVWLEGNLDVNDKLASELDRITKQMRGAVIRGPDVNTSKKD